MNSFKKAERLCSKKAIDRLFKEGRAFNHYPFRVTWLEMPLETPYPAQVLISVSKKKFNKAVDRNRVKRIIREAYRFNKTEFYSFLTKRQKQCALAIVYTAGDVPDLKQSIIKIKALLKRLPEEQMKTENN